MLFFYSGIHICRPFHHLLIDPDITYSKLKIAFKKLYEDLTTIPATSYLTTEKVVSFVTVDMFEESLPKDALLEVLKESMKTYPSEIEQLIAISLKNVC